MENYNLKITHLCMGLGLSVLIELDYTLPVTGARHFVGLLDCGSIAGGKTFYEPALQKIVAAVGNNGGRIDYLHISHFDDDHYNKLGKLAELYDSTYHARITVQKLIFGCVGNKNPEDIAASMREFFIVNELYESTNTHFFPNWHVYCLPSPLIEEYFLYENIEVEPNVYFRICPILYHSHLIPKAKGLTDINLEDEGVKINTGSSILLVAIVNEVVSKGRISVTPYVSYVFTGDATLETMKILQRMNLVFGREDKLLLVSHHGAKRHVADNENANDYTTLRSFLRRVAPSSAVVSAKCKNQAGWTHPHADTINVYALYLPGISGFNQDLTGFYWDSTNEKMLVIQGTINKEFYQTFRLNKNVVPNLALYGNCAKSSYEKIDVVMTSGSAKPKKFELTEDIRR